MRILEIGGFKKSQIVSKPLTTGEREDEAPDVLEQQPKKGVMSSFSMSYCNRVIAGRSFKKVDLSTAQKGASKKQIETLRQGVNTDGLTVYQYDNKGVDFVYFLVDEVTGDISYISPDGKPHTATAPYYPEPVMFRALEVLEDFPAGWYQVATYRESTNKFSPIVVRLSVLYKSGVGLAQLYIPVNNSYYIENSGGGIPESVIKQIQEGLVRPHKTYAEAKSDKVDITALIESGIFPGAHE